MRDNTLHHDYKIMMVIRSTVWYKTISFRFPLRNILTKNKEHLNIINEWRRQDSYIISFLWSKGRKRHFKAAKQSCWQTLVWVTRRMCWKWMTNWFPLSFRYTLVSFVRHEQKTCDNTCYSKQNKDCLLSFTTFHSKGLIRCVSYSYNALQSNS